MQLKMCLKIEDTPPPSHCMTYLKGEMNGDSSTEHINSCVMLSSEADFTIVYE